MKQHLDSINNAARIILDKLELWMHTLISMLPNLLLAVLVIVGFIFLAKFSTKLLRRVLRRFSSHSAVIDFITTIIRIGIIIVGFFIALGLLNLDKTVTSLLAGAGIAGLALSFAFQDTAANFISGIMLAIRHPIRVGHLVKISSYFGTVERINLRATLLRTLQGQMVIIPNKDVLQNAIENFSITGERRIDLKVGISYGEDLEKVKVVTLDAVKKIDYLHDNKPVDFYYEEFVDSSINFVVRYWIHDTKQVDYKQAVSDGIINIKKAYDQNDIMIPFPIRTLDFGIKGGEKLSQMLQTKSQ
ncbi:MAG: mechanosensitive ion channel [Sphingobacteriales bacterium]|nr:MAG: mechanosensitive ion channel [Sphingobacteriales bacterium]